MKAVAAELVSPHRTMIIEMIAPNTRAIPVSYTHLTLPTKRIVEISVVAVSIKKKTHAVLYGHRAWINIAVPEQHVHLNISDTSHDKIDII